VTPGTIIPFDELRARRQAAMDTRAPLADWVPLERTAAEAYREHFRHEGALNALAVLHRELEAGLIPALASAQTLARRDDLSAEAEALVGCLLDCLGHVAEVVRDLGADGHALGRGARAEIVSLPARSAAPDSPTGVVG
jgi:hypothetical protein